MGTERMGLFKRFRSAIFEKSPEKKADTVSEAELEEDDSLNPAENQELEEVESADDNSVDLADEELLEEKIEAVNEEETIIESELEEQKSEESEESSSEIDFEITNVEEESEPEEETEEMESVVEENIEEEVKQDSVEEDLPVEVKFATEFSERGGKFVYCETIDELKASLGSLMDSMEWDRVFLWEDEVKTLVANNKYQKNPLGFNMEQSDVAISFCEFLVADDASVIFSPYQASQRGLQVFPENQIVIAKPSQVLESMEQAVESFEAMYKDQLPSALNLDPEVKSRTISGKLVLSCGGTRDVIVFLCEEL